MTETDAHREELVVIYFRELLEIVGRITGGNPKFLAHIEDDGMILKWVYPTREVESLSIFLTKKCRDTKHFIQPFAPFFTRAIDLNELIWHRDGLLPTEGYIKEIEIKFKEGYYA